MVNHHRLRKSRFFTGGMPCTGPTISTTPVVELLGRVLLRRVDRAALAPDRVVLFRVDRVVLPLARVLLLRQGLLSWERRLLLCRAPLLRTGG